MGSSHRWHATTFIAGLCIVAACTSAATPAPDLTPTWSPSIIPVAASQTARPSPTGTASPSPAVTPRPTPEPAPVTPPPKPAGVTFDQQERVVDEQAVVVEITQTVTWEAPRSEGVDIRVYGVIGCIAEPANPLPGTSGPCLVVHTPLPASVRTLLATAPASDGVVSWTWTQQGAECGETSLPFRAVVLAAYGSSDRTIFAIAWPGRWWREGLDEIVC